MSIGKQQIIHIVSEVVIITGISIYFQLKVRNLNNDIERMKNKIEQQDQVIQNHEQLLLKIMSNVDLMNMNMSEMRKTLEDNKTNFSSSSVKIKKDKDKQSQSKNTSTKKLPTNFQQKSDHQVSQFPNNQQMFFPNIPNNENIFVMEIKPSEKILNNSHKIEEILEEQDDEDLDKELEKELKELEKEFIKEKENDTDGIIKDDEDEVKIDDEDEDDDDEEYD